MSRINGRRCDYEWNGFFSSVLGVEILILIIVFVPGEEIEEMVIGTGIWL